jgi:hypothetical protein
MQRALLIKEFRELALWGLLALVGLSLAFISCAGTNPFTLQPNWSGEIPFIGPSAKWLLQWIGLLAAVVFGFRQTLGETLLGTWPLLLHRTVDRRRIIALKLLVGTAVLLVATLLPFLGFAIWAAIPGTHASPFRWDFTGPTWIAWTGLPMAYFAAFLCGLRDARWLGSRLLPLAAAVAIFFAIPSLHLIFPAGEQLLALLVADAVFLAAIFQVTSVQDFA